jgi:hypothetical protein
VFEVDPNTVLQGLMEAADPPRACSPHFLHDVRVRQVQLAERFARSCTSSLRIIPSPEK